jgi:hypothetical protein
MAFRHRSVRAVAYVLRPEMAHRLRILGAVEVLLEDITKHSAVLFLFGCMCEERH